MKNLSQYVNEAVIKANSITLTHQKQDRDKAKAILDKSKLKWGEGENDAEYFFIFKNAQDLGKAKKLIADNDIDFK